MSTTMNNKGFTLVETIVAITLGVVVSIAAIGLFVSGLQHIRQAKELSYLQSNATFITNTFDYMVKQAETLEPKGESAVLMVDGKTIARNGDDIIINNGVNGAPLNDKKAKVSDLHFIILDNSVQVCFTLQTNTGEEMSLQTTIAKRNNYAN
jgi:type II secretory pathway pseudopilin PulG